MFDMKSPCANCPFRKGMGEKFELGEDRVEDIARATAFQCHNTVEYGADEYGEPVTAAGANPQQCAGLMVVLLREGRPNSIMRLAIYMGELDPAKLDPDNLAYDTLEEAIDAHRD